MAEKKKPTKGESKPEDGAAKPEAAAPGTGKDAPAGAASKPGGASSKTSAKPAGKPSEASALASVPDGKKTPKAAVSATSSKSTAKGPAKPGETSRDGGKTSIPATAPKSGSTKSGAEKTGSDKDTSAKPGAAKSDPAKSDPPKDAATKVTPAASPTKPAATTSDSTAKPASSRTAPESAPARKGGFGGMVLGGVIAACIGGALVYFLLPQLSAPDTAWRDQVAAAQEAQGQKIDALETKLAELPPPAEMPDLGDLETGQQEMRATLDDLKGQVETLQSRLGAVESRPVAEGSGVSEGDVTDLQTALDAQRAALAEQKDRIDALIAAADARKAAVESAATATLQQAALTRIRTALDTGAPFEDALADLAKTGADVPDDLRAAAADGVPTLATLEAEFPPAARIALRDARKERADAGEGETGVMAFLGEQLGARSLEPREGNDPDAVLSRAEAALRDGRLADALAEIEALPPSGQAALQGWADSARTRMNATDAADALAAQLN